MFPKTKRILGCNQSKGVSSLAAPTANRKPRLTKCAAGLRIEAVLPESGPVAQLGARFHGMEEVVGSIPVRSTNQFKHLDKGATLRARLTVSWATTPVRMDSPLPCSRVAPSLASVYEGGRVVIHGNKQSHQKDPGRNRFLSPVIVLTTALCSTVLAQDTRNVTEPKVPPFCAKLDANLTSVFDGRFNTLSPADESELVTDRIQFSIDSCGKGKAVALVVHGGSRAFLSGPLEVAPRCHPRHRQRRDAIPDP